MELYQFIIENQDEILLQLWQHFYIFLISIVIAIFIGISFSIYITRPGKEEKGKMMLSIAGAAQAVPPLAVVALAFIFVGIGALPSMIALVLYSIVPIVFNTTSGILNVNPEVIEAARGMGYKDSQIILRVKLPLAMPVIMAGIRSAATINIGTATIASFIGGGGLGDYIFMGLQLYRADMILTGAVLVALMAVSIDFMLMLVEKYAAQNYGAQS